MKVMNQKNFHPDDSNEFSIYRQKVLYYTKIFKKKLEYTGFCYYTKVPLIKKGNPNDQLKASIDHKISIVSGFLQQINPEVIGGLENLCWTSKQFNSFKQGMNENDMRLSGIIERYLRVYNELKDKTK